MKSTSKPATVLSQNPPPFLPSDIFSKNDDREIIFYRKVSNVMGEPFQIDSGPFLTVPATPGRISIFFRFQKKWFLGGLEMVQNPHSWGWRNSHLFWCFFRLSTCTHLKHLNNASKILWKVPQVWGFWAFVDHPKTTFFETKKKLKFGREWPELSRMVLNRFGKAHP